jgi:orotate phosphoribosyltransferase
MKVIIPGDFKDPLELLTHCGGFYRCPKDDSGKRCGPLVGYAGRDDQGRQYVGDVYVNFACAERHGPVLRWITRRLVEEAETVLEGFPFDPRICAGFCGAPEGGRALACTLALETDMQFIFPERKLIAPASTDSREETKLIFGRHNPEWRESWWIVEDVCNNFSTTNRLIDLIESSGSRVAGILCFLNRSLKVGGVFGIDLPVISLVREPISQYSQSDSEVAHDIANGNVVWKPKDEWQRLSEAMEGTRQ